MSFLCYWLRVQLEWMLSQGMCPVCERCVISFDAVFSWLHQVIIWFRWKSDRSTFLWFCWQLLGTWLNLLWLWKIDWLLIEHQSLVSAAPAYLADDCHLLSDAGRCPLRSHSNDIRKLLVPRTHNKLGDRSFSAAGPRLWNDLPPGLRRLGLSFYSFRQSLKTHLFGEWSA